MSFGQQEYFGVPDRSQYLILDSGDDEYYEDGDDDFDDELEDEDDFEDDDEDEE